MIAEYSGPQRLTPYTGAALDDFSRLMYGYTPQANDGFTFTDIDGILRNHKKKTLAVIEVKTRGAGLTYAQTKIFNEFDVILKRGVIGTDWTYVGFYLIAFENTSFANGRAWINGKEATEQQFISFLSKRF